MDICRRILKLVKPQWFRLLSAMLCMMAAAALTGAIAYLVKPVLDDIFFKKNMQMLKLLPLAIIFVDLFKGAASFAQAYLMNYVGHTIIKQLRDDLYTHLQILPLSFFYKHDTGPLMASGRRCSPGSPIA